MLHLYSTVATFERELLLFVVLRYIVLLLLELVKDCFDVTDLSNTDLRYRPPQQDSWRVARYTPSQKVITIWSCLC